MNCKIASTADQCNRFSTPVVDFISLFSGSGIHQVAELSGNEISEQSVIDPRPDEL
jgi:hypothetical protein